MSRLQPLRDVNLTWLSIFLYTRLPRKYSSQLFPPAMSSHPGISRALTQAYRHLLELNS